MSGAIVDEEATFEEATYQTEDVTITEVTVYFGDYLGKDRGAADLVFTGKGSAKTNPEDEFDQYLGHRLALARALQDVAAEILNDYFGKKRKERG